MNPLCALSTSLSVHSAGVTAESLVGLCLDRVWTALGVSSRILVLKLDMMSA